MSKYIEPIYDRDANDIANRTAKAFFNVADWLRIYNNTQYAMYLAELLPGIDVLFNAVNDPTITTIPSVDDLNTLLENIDRIKTEVVPALTLNPVAVGWTGGASEDAPTYIDANSWENAINALINAIAGLVDYQVFCGVSAVGQSRYYQHRWRRYAWIQESASPIRTPRTNVAIAGSDLKNQNGFRRYN